MHKRLLRTGMAVLMCFTLTTTTVFGANLSLRYNNKNHTYKGKQLTVTYKGKKLSLGKTPGIQLNSVNMVPYSLVFYMKGPKVKRSYNSKTGRLKLTNGSKNIIFYRGKKYAYTNGKKRTLSVAPVTVKYRNVNKSYLMVPVKFTAKYLGISYGYSKSAKRIDLAKPKTVATTTATKPTTTTAKATTTTSATTTATTATSTTKTTTYNVGVTLSDYIKKQLSACPTYSGNKLTTANYTTYIDPSKDTTKNYQFLKLDTYRAVNTTTYNTLLNNKVNSSSVLKNKGSQLIAAAKKQNIDPIYFLCQTVLETGYGTSTLSQGKSITKIVSGKSVIKDSKGNVTGFQKVDGKYITSTISAKKVYNLYGIKAYDSDPQLCGFSYAYYMNWTSVDKAISGAAEYISSNYINHATYKQNTLYKYRYNPNTTYIWHQYATDPAYAVKIANLMYTQFRSAYSSGVSMTFDKPKYK